MENGLRPEKSTGYTQSTMTESESASVQTRSTGGKSASPVFPNAPTKGESSISTVEALVSKILAIQVMMGDFKALRSELPESRTSSRNGKIYWSAELPGHELSVVGGVLLIDGISADAAISTVIRDGIKAELESPEG